MRPFARIPCILYLLIINLLFAPFLGVSLSFYIVQKCFPEITYMDIEVLLLFWLGIVLPYVLGEVLYRGIVFLKQHISHPFMTKTIDINFSRITSVLFLILTVVNLFGGCMLGTGLTTIRKVRLLLQNIPFDKLQEKDEANLSLLLPEGYKDFRLLRGTNFIVIQIEGADKRYDTIDDIIVVRHQNP